MKVGASIRNITPSMPLQMSGYPESPISKGIHDPLWLSVYYLDDGKEKAVYLTADLLNFARARADKMTKAIWEATGIPEENILLAATHTHYAPATDCDVYQNAFGPEICPEYMDFVQASALDAVKEAIENAFEAELGYGVGYCGKEQGIGGNRHDPEKYCQDPDVAVLAFKDGETVKGVLVNYALHPTVMPSDTDQITADYVGYLRTAVVEAYPDAVFGFMQGCSGNQSSRYYRTEQSDAEAERFGRTIGAEALRVLSDMQFDPLKNPMQVKKTLFNPSNLRAIPSYPDAVEARRAAAASYEAQVAAGAPTAVCRSAECTKIGTEIMEAYARDAEAYGAQTVLDSIVPVELHYLVLDDLVIAAVAAEVFADVALAVKAASPYAVTMMSTVTGGSSQCYICAEYAFEAMYYEPSESLFGCGTAEELAKVIQTELRQIKK